MLRPTSVMIVLSILVSGCTSKAGFTEGELTQYTVEINAWHEHRLEEIKARDGWLNLVGLYWLEPGANTFGSGDKNKIVFPTGSIEEEAGYFLVTGNRVAMHLNKNVSATIKGKAAVDPVVFSPDTMRQPQVENEKVAWTIIRRDTRFGVRVRDLTMEAVGKFKGIERFPVDRAYRMEATFIPSSGRTIDITNVIGQTTAQHSPGTISFFWQGDEYQLDVLEGGDKEYFVIIADETSARETYAGGRYLYVNHADEKGNIILDFNKAYNPPCVFTPFATCPLPPRQNVLPFSVRAGEKIYGSASLPNG